MDASDPDRESRSAGHDELPRLVAELRRAVREQRNEIGELRRLVDRQEGRIRHLERWEFEHPPVPASAWAEDDYAAEEGMDRFLHGLKKTIHDIRSGRHGNRVCLSPRDDPQIDYVNNYDALLPYWKELADAMLCSEFMERVASGEGSEFHLSGIELGDEMMNVLAPAVKANHFKKLHLSDNASEGASEDGERAIVLFMMDVLEHVPQLESLYFQYNPIERDEDIHRLCHLVGHHPSLKHLTVYECGGQDPSTSLLPLLATSNRLETFDLTGNNICSDGSTAIFHSIANNHSLRTLNLCGNHFNNHDAIMVATALESNATLTTLFLDSYGTRNITKLGRDALFKCTFNPVSLNAVAACNHTCQVHLPPADGNDGTDIPSINGGYSEFGPSLAKKMVRTMKLLTLLSAPNEDACNIHYLDDLPLELVPKLFEIVQQYPDKASLHDGILQHHWRWMSELRSDTPRGTHDDAEREAHILDPKPARIKRLSMTYEILRGWRMQTGEPIYILRNGPDPTG